MPTPHLAVFAISLPRFKKRYAYINGHLAARFGNGYEILGIDGAEADADSVGDHRLSPGQIGCALSHLAAYKRIEERNLPYALIVEDDAVLPKNICQILDDLSPYFSDEEIIQLYNWGGGGEYSGQMTVKIHRNMMLCHPMRASDLGGTSTYVIGSGAARGILSANYPVKVTADNWEFFFKSEAVKVARILHPSPVSVKPFETTLFQTKIQNAYFGRMIQTVTRTLFYPILLIRRTMMIRKRRRLIEFCDRPSEMAISR